MKVCGFTFIKNAIKFDFPIEEAIKSVLPICHHFVVAVGKSDDQTLGLVKSISPEKISILETEWDESLREGGQVYADETNKAFDAIPDDYDWCFYIQGDEVIHEKYLESVKQSMEDNLNNEKVEGLLFKYRHFFGSYDYVGDCRHWYRNEIRVIRNNKNIRSYKDAQGFRKNNQKLNVLPVQAEIYHYGWVRHPKFMQQKVEAVKLYYNRISEREAQSKAIEREFNYTKEFDALAPFTGSHPEVMLDRIKRLNWEFQPDLTKVNMKLKYRLLHFIEKQTGKRLFEYRNYKLIKK